MNTARKQLLNTTVVYFIGSALTQVVSLFLLRFVTGRISAEEYGYYNLIVTIDNLITPIFTLQIGDALFRYFIKAENQTEKKQYYTNAIFLVYVGGLLMAAGLLLVNFSFYQFSHLFWVIMYVLSTNLYNLYLKIVRSMGKNKEFATLGFAKTIIYIALQMIFLFGFGLGGECLFMSVTLSTLVAILAIEIWIKPHQYLNFKMLNKDKLKQMLTFSFPLIPNTMLWWLCSSINSLIISMRLGLDINGIYSVANKFSNILVMVTNMFSTAWQESVIKEYDKVGFKRFQTETFNMYILLVLSGVTALIPTIKIAIPYLIDESYYSAIQYVPFLLFATAFSTFSGYAAQILTAQEKTKSVMLTSVIGTLANLIVVALTVDRLGLWSAVWGTVVSNVLLTAIRLFLVRHEFDKDIKFFKFSVLVLLATINVFAYFYAGVLINSLLLLFTLIVAVFFNIELIKDFLQIFFSKLKRKKT